MVIRAAATVVFVIVAAITTGGIWVMQQVRKVPVGRLAENIERQLRTKPEDISLRLNLARLYAMAYALKIAEVDARSEGGNLEPWFGHIPPDIPPSVKRAPTPDAQRRADADLARALALYEDLVARAPDNFIARLGYGWTLEQAGRKDDAIREYRKVVELGYPAERSGGQRLLMHGQRAATVEAADRLKALLDPAANKDELAALREKTRELEGVVRAITPIAIPVVGGAAPPLDLDARVHFDADGSGIARRWTWITPDAGWLVYDADGAGRITSALQWFGNVTFWLFWNNGYDALAALDDDADGELRGAELRHLAIWNDRNQNGVSEPGEVRPLSAHGIVALSCRYLETDDPWVIASSPFGVRFANGETRPTYDVVLHARPEQDRVQQQPVRAVEERPERGVVGK